MADCSHCDATLPEEVEEETGVYCPECGHGQLVSDGGQPTLRFTDDGIEIPDRVNLSEGVVFRARGVTVDHMPGGPDSEFYPAFSEGHLTADGRDVINEQLDENEVSIKPYGKEAETYRVAVAMADGGEAETADQVDDEFAQKPDALDSEELEIDCINVAEDCDWSATIEVDPDDIESTIQGMIEFPNGVPTTCPLCGDRRLSYNGEEVTFHA